jgi:5-methylcytosine-specific restriction endonuclease McrA
VQQHVPNSIEVYASYTSPKGRNHYSRTYKINTYDVLSIVGDIVKRNEYQKTKAYQRALMTPALRFAVLERDGFKCCYCGASANDGATLEIDHIIPVAKGGKTELNNLQTLCWDCNHGKSDKIVHVA